MNLDRFGLLQDPEFGLLRAPQTGAFLERAPAASTGTRSLRGEVLERSFGAPTPAKKKKKKKTATAAKPTKKKPSKKTKTKAKKPAEKAKATSKEEQRELLKNQFELVDFTEDITQMSLDTLRRHFGYISGAIDKGLFVNNVIWQVYRLFQTGEAPPFIKNGGSVRSFWYHVKKVVQDHPRAFKVKKDLDGLFSKQLSAMVRAGLISYKDLKITDDRESFRKLAPVYGNPHIILLGEKFSFLSKLIELHLQYGITIQCSKGMPLSLIHISEPTRPY